ncbi:oxygen-dependent coproporphyrinogen oxidase [Hydrotalea sp.]|uniref:oxygen-dependent coproporphyrinogen oxidase n=1 Tax=Hydrotalea sp. TaxID=2881279 RepID=UPI002620F9DC|nr:oxygen-dependent coproporphyrinogen oxidase [Hydrotalea sp.]
METDFLPNTTTKTFREEWIQYTHTLQDTICNALELADGNAVFIQDEWQRKPDGTGGGGKTRVIANGNIFEKGGVNTSVVYGTVSEPMRKQLQMDGDEWLACGLSLVIHPYNPFVPTIHCNYRYFELYANNEVINRWFGGGTDLTPYYLVTEDAIHFHQTYKNTCDQFDTTFYPLFKTSCDNYFVNTHRNNERRGIGGIFYDHQKPTPEKDEQFWLNLAKACGQAFLDAYLPIVEKRKNTSFTEQHKYWQEIRRGRYVEFNLLHDRGTIFGLKTNGRTESILMSLPPTVRFNYNYQPEAGTPEAILLDACMHPRDWLKEYQPITVDEWMQKTNQC